MHEGSIAKSLFQVAELTRQKEGLKEIKEVKIVIGALHHIVPEVLQMHFDLMKGEQKGFNKAVLEIKECRIKLLCSECQALINIQEACFICPKCQSTETEVAEGNELYIESITGV